jgi:hypothetical protein
VLVRLGGCQDEPVPEGAILVQLRGDERQRGPDAWDASDGVRRDAERDAGHRGRRCPEFADAGAGKLAARAQDDPAQDALFLLERLAQRLPEQPAWAALCKQGVDRSAEQSFAALPAVEQLAARGGPQRLELAALLKRKPGRAGAQIQPVEQSLPAAPADVPMEAPQAELVEPEPEPNRQAFPSGEESSQADEPEQPAPEWRPELQTRRQVRQMASPEAAQQAGSKPLV